MVVVLVLSSDQSTYIGLPLSLQLSISKAFSADDCRMTNKIKLNRSSREWTKTIYFLKVCPRSVNSELLTFCLQCHLQQKMSYLHLQHLFALIYLTVGL